MPNMKKLLLFLLLQIFLFANNSNVLLNSDLKSYEWRDNIVNQKEIFFKKYRNIMEILFKTSPLFLLLLLGLIHNIYKRKKLEIELRQRIDFDEVLLNAIDSPIFWQDDRGVVVDSNKTFCELIDMTTDKIYGKKLSSFRSNKNINNIVAILESYQEDNTRKPEFKHYDKNHHKRLFLVQQEKFHDKKLNKQGSITIFTDVTKERKELFQKQRDRQFIIQQSKLAEIGEVFSSIAHQWKAPLVEITSIAQELFYSKKIIDKDLKENESFVSDIMKQVDYMNSTINNFQEFIMPSHSKSNFCIDIAIKEMLDIVNHNVKYNNIIISIDIAKNTNCEIYGYKNEFMQSFLNIVNNAKEQLLHNDYKNRHIMINIFNNKDFLYLEIEDNAGGIKQRNKRKIFKPYFTTKKEGHGIGLYMAKMIIEDKMDGKLFVKNTQKGAKFTMQLNQEL